MGWRGTLVLAAALLAAATWLALEVVRERAPLSLDAIVGFAPAPPGEQVTRILTFDPATITALRVRRGAREVRASRQDHGWAGVDQPAAIDDFLVALTDLAEVMPLDVTGPALAEHGLDPPDTIIELDRADAPPLMLFLGHHNPPSTGVYAQLGNNGRVVLTGALATWEVEKLLRALSPTAAP